jgi:hypothetical protein
MREGSSEFCQPLPDLACVRRTCSYKCFSEWQWILKMGQQFTFVPFNELA